MKMILGLPSIYGRLTTMIYVLSEGELTARGIARDAAGRGFKVLLVDQGDFAGCTSSASSKMIHGGLRYLEFFDFGVVRKSLAEREIMMAIAPEIVHPLEFCIPHQNSVRPAWMVRLGLFIYDHLWPRKKPPVIPKNKFKKTSLWFAAS
jgi:glycerol-3-phosphate dehydrogenase